MKRNTEEVAHDRIELLPVRTAIKLATGCEVHAQTARNWTSQGVRGVRLKSWLLGSRRMTTTRSVLAFIQATNDFEPTAAQQNESACQSEN